ncbi:MAG: bifunctional RNase H/acid phosphatase [Nocardioidaceae bacterium]|nr:bifunctional RNase H/acid phosphatase [Nocardioidaceae bacterium]
MRVIVECDGGSRGNPGPAAYGSILRNADTGEVIAQKSEFLGIVSNNVAEYRGLIAGLELVAEQAPGAQVEVRMDSKLVIEQMAGRWKIKHPDMKQLAIQAQRLAPPDVTWTWVPRETNKTADALVNAVLDGGAPEATVTDAGAIGTSALDESGEAAVTPAVGWSSRFLGDPTTLILVRHGVTDNTVRKLFCGAGGTDPALNDEGRAQAQRAADYLKRTAAVDAILSSPLQRTKDTAGIIASTLGLEVSLEDGIVEAAFGDWDGSSFQEISERWPTELNAWLASTSYAPPGGGETFDSVYERVEAFRDRLLTDFAGKTVVATSHVTPIKMLVRLVLEAPMRSIYRMELAPASITTIQWWADGTPSLRTFSFVP